MIDHIKIKQSYLDISIALLIAITMFSFPLFFRNLNTTLYSFIFNGIIIFNLYLIYLATYQIKVSIRHNFFSNKYITMFFIFYILYFFSALASSTQYINNENDIRETLVWIRNLLIVILILIFMSDKMIQKFNNYYTSFVTLISFLALIMTIMIYFDLIHPLDSIVISDQIRDLYLFGFRWANSWIGDQYNIVRLQSFSDEAGNMAFTILPALILAYNNHNYLQVSLLSVALLATFSVGAIIVYFILVLYIVIKQKQLFILLSLSVFFIFILVQYNDSFFATYFSSKLGNEENFTSVSQRVNEFEVALLHLQNNMFGLGATAFNKLEISMAIGWLAPLIQFGIISYCFYLIAFFSLFILALKTLFQDNGMSKALASIVLILFFASLQRAPIDFNVWNWYWIIVFFRLR